MSTGDAKDLSPRDRRRRTTQRESVREWLDTRDTFVSAQDLHAEMRGSGVKVGLATVYRNLQVMAEDGELDVLRTGAGESLYRKCGVNHHHHLVCRLCGLTVEVAGSVIERWVTKVAMDHGFSDVTHTAELLGVCSICSR